MKKILTLTVLALISVMIYAQVDAPVNPDYLRYLQKKDAGIVEQFTSDGNALGEIPPVETLYFQPYKPDDNSFKFPVSYDLRTLNQVTSVKNQNPYGTCWAHAGVGAIESYWLKMGYGTYNLSESNTATCHGFEWLWNDGGNCMLAAAYFTRLSGPISEVDDPYSRLALDDTLCHTGETPVAYETEVYFIPGNSDDIKQAVMDYGAIYTNYYHDNAYYNSTAKTYYCPDDLGTNHAVLIVGWDDNKVVSGAPGNGAWIIKNSWGTGWGESGYFYISYHDVNVNTSVACFVTKETYDAQAALYMYDELGYIGSTGFTSETGYGLTKFIASGNQSITKVGTFVNSEGATIDIDIYDTKTGNTLSDLLGSVTGQVCDYPGYYMFDLSSAINIDNGNDFYVKVKYNTPGNNYPIPYEKYYAGYANPTIEAGVCWASSSGASWTAWGNDVSGKERDLCIRAYATPQAPTYDVTFNIDDGTNPIENAEVTLNGNPQMTNASGQTVFSGLSDGIYPYSVTKAGFQDDNGNVTVSGGNVIKNISLSQATYNVTFNVKDADTNPIENAEVTFDGSPQYTNASGTTIFSGYVNGIYPYSVTKSGYVTDNGNVTISGNHVVKNVTLNLQTYDVTFNVSDGTSPIENAEVIFDGSTQYTNASGSTVFAGVEVGSALPYSVTKAGYMDVNSTVDVVDQNVTENVVMGESIPTTTLMAANCGASYTTSNTWIYCYEITGAEDYEFKFVNIGESFNETVLMSTVWGSPIHNYFRLYHVPNLKFGVTYDVQVRSKVSGTWSDYGAVCQVTLKGTKLSTAYCGATVSTTNYTIYADMISGATNYEFRFVNTGEGFEESQTTVSVWGASYGSRNYLKLMYIPNLEYGLTYDVQVRALVNGIWSNYDDVCQFTLSVGLTKLIDGQCGGSINYPNYYIYCDLVYQAEDYEFRFVNAGAGFDQSRTTSSVWGATYGWRRYMRLYYIPGLQYGLTYDVQVRARINGTWGAYGTVCQFTYGPSTKEGTFSGNSNMALNIKPQLFPNPFDKSTTFVLSGDNDQEFNVYICDVTGKILNEQFLYSNTEYIIGEELDRGVYFLIILGHNNSMNETLKFIKQ